MRSARSRHIRVASASVMAIGLGAFSALHVIHRDRSEFPAVNPKTDGGTLLAALPMRFETNAGQVDSDVRFVARGAGYAVYFTETEAVLQLPPAARTKSGVLRMRLSGAQRSAPVRGEDQSGGTVNYFTGGAARTDIATYQRIRYGGIYDGVDLVYYGTQGRLEYDFVVAPGGKPSDITMALEGARDVAVTADGDLVIDLGGRSVVWQSPVTYQESDGARRVVDGRYVVRRDGAAFAIGFDVAPYDPKLPLVIDPVLAYSTYLSGTNQESAYAVGVDREGHVYVAGNATSLDYPRTNHALQNSYAGGRQDIFITKLDADVKHPKVHYSTYLGGSGDDFVLGLALRGGDGPEVYVTGATESTDFPITKHAFQEMNRGGYDAFIARLAGDGNHLEYSSYLGGSGDENLGLFGGIAVNREGDAFVTGDTASADFLASSVASAPSFQPALRGATDAFVAKITHNGHSIAYASYLGGEGLDSGSGIAADDLGNAYVVGSTSSTSFPVTPGASQPASGGNGDAFYSKIGPKGTLAYSTYLGGTDVDFATGVALDDNRQIYIAGATASTNFPTTGGAFQTATTGPAHGGYDGFVLRFNRTGGLNYSTLLGGSDADVVQGVAVDVLGSAYVVGFTLSSDFPRVDAFKSSLAAGDSDAFVAKIGPSGTNLVYSSYLGGAGADRGQAVAVDRYGAAHVVGGTTSRDFPATPDAVQSAARGINMAFLAKVAGSKKALRN